MLITIVLVLVVIALAVSTGAVLWYRSQMRKLGGGYKSERLPFRWRYVLLPLILFGISALITIAFYPWLPWMSAYHFDDSGAPDGWAFRQAVVGIGLGIQALLVFTGAVITHVISRAGVFSSADASGIKPVEVITFMGNLVALPQLVLIFAMVDIFGYNAYQKHLLSLWLFLIIVFIMVTVALIVFPIIILLRAGKNRDGPKL